MGIKLDRIWSMPNKSTFLIPPIDSLIKRHYNKEFLWVDPFSGWSSPAQITNDLNTEIEATYTRYWSQCKNEIARILKPGGKVISFGWSSMGLGKIRNFKMIEVLLVPHGGSRYDTIVTVEIKGD